MSRIGKQPITLPDGVKVELQDHSIRVKGPKGTLERDVHPLIQVSLVNGQLIVARKGDTPLDRSLHGLTRALLQNLVTGVSDGFSKYLEISGIGYKALKQGEKLVLQVGFTHPVEFDPPPGITIETDGTRITVSGADREAVGALAARIRRVRNPDPYKAKGIKYRGEVIRRKAGKALGKEIRAKGDQCERKDEHETAS
jgi:large subunit ribosomal protein L6